MARVGDTKGKGWKSDISEAMYTLAFPTPSCLTFVILFHTLSEHYTMLTIPQVCIISFSLFLHDYELANNETLTAFKRSVGIPSRIHDGTIGNQCLQWYLMPLSAA